MINSSGALSASAELSSPLQSSSVNGAIIQAGVLVDVHLGSPGAVSLVCVDNEIDMFQLEENLTQYLAQSSHFPDEENGPLRVWQAISRGRGASLQEESESDCLA